MSSEHQNSSTTAFNAKEKLSHRENVNNLFIKRLILTVVLLLLYEPCIDAQLWRGILNNNASINSNNKSF